MDTILFGTWGNDGWAIYSPLCKGIKHNTFRPTRKESILSSGCNTTKKWKYLYSQGFRAIKVNAEYDLK